MATRWLSSALFLTAVALPLAAQDIVNYKDVRGAQFREYQRVVRVDAFDCEAVIGKKCQMTVTVENKGDKPELFNATQLSIDNGKGSTYRAIPLEGQSAAALKKELAPGQSASFS